MIVIVLKGVKPTPLNKLYTPILKWFNNKQIASLVLSKESRVAKKLIQSMVLQQKQDKMLVRPLLFYMDIDVKKIKSPDIDDLLKQILDALEDLCYKNDKQILDLRVRKHLNAGEDKITIRIDKIEEVEI